MKYLSFMRSPFILHSSSSPIMSLWTIICSFAWTSLIFSLSWSPLELNESFTGHREYQFISTIPKTTDSSPIVLSFCIMLSCHSLSPILLVFHPVTCRYGLKLDVNYFGSVPINASDIEFYYSSVLQLVLAIL